MIIFVSDVCMKLFRIFFYWLLARLFWLKRIFLYYYFYFFVYFGFVYSNYLFVSFLCC